MATQPVTIRQERNAAVTWTIFIIALMGINLVVAGFAVVMAVKDPSFKPMPSYGDQSVDWQTRKDQLQATEKLGWVTTMQRDNSTGKAVSVQIVDSKGIPVTGCSGTLKLYHFTRVNLATTAALSEDSKNPGNYIATADVQRDGLWHVELDVSRSSSERCVVEKDVEWGGVAASQTANDKAQP